LGKLAYVKHFRVFGSKFYIKNDEDNLGKLDPISNEGIFLGTIHLRRNHIDVIILDYSR
jgi:hypothetical protein